MRYNLLPAAAHISSAFWCCFDLAVRLLQVPIETSSSRSARRSSSQSGFSIEEVDGNVTTPHNGSEPVVEEPEEGGTTKKTA